MISFLLFCLVIWLLCKNSDLEDRVKELETRQSPERYNG